MKKFNLRVYGILKHEGHVLISHESFRGFDFHKFPGGGVEWGEGLEETLQREFQEELSLSIEVEELLFLNRDFLPSKFFKEDQVVVFYFLIHTKKPLPKKYLKDQFIANEDDIKFKWAKLDESLIKWFSLPKDIEVAKLLVSK